MRVLVLLPTATATPGDLTAGCDVVAYRGPDDIVSALAGTFEAAVILSDGLAGDGLGSVAAAVAACGRAVIEVRSERWDGTSHSPLSAACRGVVSGFGLAGIREAVRALAGS